MPKYWVKASETVEYEIEVNASSWQDAHDIAIEKLGQEPEKHESDRDGFQIDDWCEMIEN